MYLDRPGVRLSNYLSYLGFAVVNLNRNKARVMTREVDPAHKFWLVVIRKIKNKIKNYQSNRGQSWRRGTKCGCKIDWLWVRSPLDEKKYLFTFIFSILRSGGEAKRSVDFRHSTRNASRTCRKVGNGVS